MNIFTSDQPDPTHLRWIQKMTPYRLDISYIAGNINTVADYFSRPLIASVSSPTLISNISITPSNVNTSSIVSTYDIDPFFAPL